MFRVRPDVASWERQQETRQPEREPDRAGAVPRPTAIRGRGPDRVQRPHSAAFASLLSFAQRISDELKTEPSSQHRKLSELVYERYVYSPHGAEEVLHIRARQDRQHSEKFLGLLGGLAEKYSDDVKIYLQPRDEQGPRLRPFDAITHARSAADPRHAMSYVLHDPYVIERLNRSSRALKGEDGIESRLSISVKAEYAGPLAEVLIDLCRSNLDGFSSAKIMGAAEHGVRSETGILYLSDADPEQAALLAQLVHEKLERKVQEATERSRAALASDADFALLANAPADLYEGDFYVTSPPGTQAVRPGIAYSEKPYASDTRTSSGMEKTGVVAEAIMLHHEYNVPLEIALEDCLTRMGYSPTNPAFALRLAGGLDEEDCIKLLQGRTPDRFKESTVPSSQVSQTARYRNERQQFYRRFDAGPDINS